jgi:hypothetical protein
MNLVYCRKLARSLSARTTEQTYRKMSYESYKKNYTFTWIV